MDYWTAIKCNKFLAITYHWTDDGLNVHAQTLDLVSVDASASGEITEALIKLRINQHFAPREPWGEAVREEPRARKELGKQLEPTADDMAP